MKKQKAIRLFFDSVERYRDARTLRPVSKAKHRQRASALAAAWLWARGVGVLFQWDASDEANDGSLWECTAILGGRVVHVIELVDFGRPVDDPTEYDRAWAEGEAAAAVMQKLICGDGSVIDDRDAPPPIYLAK